MEIVVGRPPNYNEIIKAFRSIQKGTIFCWGQTIFNPGNIHITDALRAHESVHSRRQNGDPEGWWSKYIASPSFRLQEELPAHQVELSIMLKDANRQERRRSINVVSGRLSGRLYGGLIKKKEAIKILEGPRLI